MSIQEYSWQVCSNGVPLFLIFIYSIANHILEVSISVRFRKVLRPNSFTWNWKWHKCTKVVLVLGCSESPNFKIIFADSAFYLNRKGSCVLMVETLMVFLFLETNTWPFLPPPPPETFPMVYCCQFDGGVFIRNTTINKHPIYDEFLLRWRNTKMAAIMAVT